MGSSGVEWDPVKDLANMTSDPVGTIASAIVNFGTAGIFGFEDGKISSGVNTRVIGEVMGNVTGANAARKAAMQTQDRINEAKTEQEKERLRQLQLQEANERMLSLRGASQTRRSQGGSGSIGGSGVEQQMAVDFLGL